MKPEEGSRRRALFFGGALVLGALMVAAGVGVALWFSRTSDAPTAAAEPPLAAEKREVEGKKIAAASDEAGALAEAPAMEAAPRAARQERAPLLVERLGARRVSCAAACDLEEQCGFRAAPECTAASCDGELRKLARSDFQLEAVHDCARLAEHPCEEACWRRGECTGHHDGDKHCTAACRTLVQQAPRETFRESRCILERTCAELPLCAERG